MAEIEGYGLLENRCVSVAYVEDRDGTAQEWSALGTTFNASSCGRLFDIVQSCNAPAPDELVPGSEQTGQKYLIEPFALLVRQKNSVACSLEDGKEAARVALECATAYQMASVLWNGTPEILPFADPDPTGANWQQTIFIDSADVTGSTATAAPTNDWTLEAALGELLEEAYAVHPELGCCSIIHMGAQAGIALSGPIKRLGLNVVISPAYPSLGLAITGPIDIVLGSIQANENMNSVPQDNKVYIDANRLAAFAFDPCLAMRKEYS
jgi:hypothetical protein